MRGYVPPCLPGSYDPAVVGVGRAGIEVVVVNLEVLVPVIGGRVGISVAVVVSVVSNFGSSFKAIKTISVIIMLITTQTLIMLSVMTMFEGLCIMDLIIS